jgi:hypothetical protein
MFDAKTIGGPSPRLMKAMLTPSRVLAYCTGGKFMIAHYSRDADVSRNRAAATPRAAHRRLR